MLEIADDATNDYVERIDRNGEPYRAFDAENVQRSRLHVDSRKWLLAKCLPKIYGDRLATVLTGKNGSPVEVKTEMSEHELARRIAIIFDRAARNKTRRAVQSDASRHAAWPMTRAIRPPSVRITIGLEPFMGQVFEVTVCALIWPSCVEHT